MHGTFDYKKVIFHWNVNQNWFFYDITVNKPFLNFFFKSVHLTVLVTKTVLGLSDLNEVCQWNDFNSVWFAYVDVQVWL